MYKEQGNKTVISNFAVVILTLVCATAAWIPAFLFPSEPLLTQGGGSLYRTFVPFLESNPLLSNGICLLILLAMVGVQCWHSVQLRLVRTLSLLPALFILFFTGVLSSEHGISPGIPAGICIYIAFAQITSVCNTEESLWRSLEMGIFVALASLFAPTYLFYLPLFIIGMHLLNRLSGINLLGAIIGCCTPYILWMGFLYLTDQTNAIQYHGELLGQQFCINWLWSMHDGIILAIIGVGLLVSLLGFLHQHADRIHPRIVAHFAFILAFGALALSLLYHNAHHSITLILFSSLTLTQYYNYRSKKLTTVFFYTFIASLLFVYGTQFLS